MSALSTERGRAQESAQKKKKKPLANQPTLISMWGLKISSPPVPRVPEFVVEPTAPPQSEAEENPLEAAEYLKELATLETRWEARPNALKDSIRKDRQALQHRFLYLAPTALDDRTREELFDEDMVEADWSYGTAATYWSALIKAMEQVGLTVPYAARVKYTVLDFLAKEEDPRRPTKPIRKEDVDIAITALRRLGKGWLALSVWMTFFLGQRMGDTLKLSPNCFSIINDTYSGQKFLAVLFHRGKTTRRKQPFTLHIPYEMPEVHELLALAELRKSQNQPLLFESADIALLIIKAQLVVIDSELNILSIRRGGLQKMALDGCSTATILHHSRHATKDMLDPYLGFGALSLDDARERFQDLSAQ